MTAGHAAWRAEKFALIRGSFFKQNPLTKTPSNSSPPAEKRIKCGWIGLSQIKPVLIYFLSSSPKVAFASPSDVLQTVRTKPLNKYLNPVHQKSASYFAPASWKQHHLSSSNASSSSLGRHSIYFAAKI